MDYLTEHSSEFFSPDLVTNIDIHVWSPQLHKGLNCTLLHSFVMKGAIESRENVVVDHHFAEQKGEPNCTLIQFFNILCSVNITNLIMRCPAINLKESHVTVKNSKLKSLWYPLAQKKAISLSILLAEAH